MLKAFRLDKGPAASADQPDPAAVLNELIVDHLHASKLQYSLTVFQAESGCKSSRRDPVKLLQKLRLEPGSALEAQLQGEPRTQTGAQCILPSLV